MKKNLVESIIEMSPKALVENYNKYCNSSIEVDKNITEMLIQELEYRNLLESIYSKNTALLEEVKNYSENELTINFLRLSESNNCRDFIKRDAMRQELRHRGMISNDEKSLKESLLESEENDKIDLFANYFTTLKNRTSADVEEFKDYQTDTERKIYKLLNSNLTYKAGKKLCE